MRTSFAPRIDKKLQADKALDADYFNNLRRLTQAEQLRKEVTDLEAQFKELT